jgi:RNA polymerase sigma-70 factor (family 1)
LLENSAYDEKEILRLISTGDAKAFAVLFKRYNKKIYSLAYHLTHSTDQAEEVLQDVFLKIWLKQADLPSIQHFENYLFVVARNQVFTTLKKLAKRKVVTIDEELTVNSDVTPESQLIHKESLALLQQAVSRLPSQQYTVYHLSKETGLTRDQIAAQMNLSPETIKVHLSRALRSIRAYLIARRQVQLLLILLSLFSKIG